MTTNDKTTPGGMSESTAKFEREAASGDQASKESILGSSYLEAFREVQKAWCEMPFTREEDGEIADYWAVPEIRGVSKNDAYVTQCRLGALYAFEALDLVEKFKSRIREGALSAIARSIVERGQWTGFEVGFFQAMDDYINDGEINVAGGVLAWPEEDPAEAVPKSAHTTGRTKIQRLYQQALDVHEQAKKAFDLDHGHTSDLINERFSELRSQIMETPATCPQDVAIKLRLYAAIDVVEHPETLPEEGDHDRGWLRTAICDLERLDGESLTEADALLEKLAADCHVAEDASDRMQDVLDEARLKAARPDAKVVLAESGETAIHELMLQIPAAGLRGVRAKIKAMMTPFAWKRIKEADSHDFDPCGLDTDMFHSVVADLERLAGGNATERPARSERAKRA